MIFLELANNIRKERGNDKSILSRQPTRYNRKKLKGGV